MAEIRPSLDAMQTTPFRHELSNATSSTSPGSRSRQRASFGRGVLIVANPIDRSHSIAFSRVAPVRTPNRSPLRISPRDPEIAAVSTSLVKMRMDNMAMTISAPANTIRPIIFTLYGSIVAGPPPEELGPDANRRRPRRHPATGRRMMVQHPRLLAWAR